MTTGAAVRIAAGRLGSQLKPSKNVVTIMPRAVERIRTLLSKPPPSLVKSETSPLLKVGVKTKGCSGMTYTLDYVPEKAKFDEVVEQDGVKLLIDAKALLSILGSEIDYVEDKLSSQFIFYNPNVKETCGCGQSFLA